ncbi:tetracycline efflux MFS transporter Tet(V) [Arthrobacter ginkgonis]|uniref:Tetracycline efflux MFS transporter Tet(V) n=1 Tax=Arthrobacter ginkgonis TaxID=1630594 RepID=A0ABP7C7B2_9MICC
MAPRALLPFAHRDYRVLAVALAISVFGQGLWAVAMVYQVKELGGGPLELSFVATATSVGMIVFVLAGGIAADRFSCRRIILWVEAASLATAATTAVLAATGMIQLWHLAAAGFIIGAGAAFFYPAYSALLPRILPADHLLAANGVEGTMRPVLQMAAGPAAAGMIVASFSPAHAIAVMAGCHLAAVLVLNLLSNDAHYDEHSEDGAKRPSVLADLREGFVYTLKTPWLLWTLLFAVVAVFAFIGPVEVLLPFAVEEQLGGDAGTFGLILASFGIGGAVGSFAVASMRLPRRYLTWMIMLWGFGGLPLAAVGWLFDFWSMTVVLFVIGATGGMGQVIWGTLLQRRVPQHMLGRISSLDFFVSLLLMPLSMAVAGPLGTVFPLWAIFLVAGAVQPLLGVIAWFAARMYRDEIEHPLDTEPAKAH